MRSGRRGAGAVLANHLEFPDASTAGAELFDRQLPAHRPTDRDTMGTAPTAPATIAKAHASRTAKARVSHMNPCHPRGDIREPPPPTSDRRMTLLQS
jgi:hypothetical protein